MMLCSKLFPFTTLPDNSNTYFIKCKENELKFKDKFTFNFQKNSFSVKKITALFCVIIEDFTLTMLYLHKYE